MLDFTRTEKRIILFLVCTFAAGLGVKVYREKWQPLRTPVLTKADMQQDKKEENISAGSESAGKSINLNEADREELEQIPGIGPVMADRIVDYREMHGKFGSLDELTRIKGIGDKTIKKLAPYIVINKDVSSDPKGRRRNGSKIER